MRRTAVPRFATCALAFAALAPGLSAQTTYPNVKLAGRVQSQFYMFDNDAFAPSVGTQSNFFIRRARIEATGQLAEHVSFYIQPSFEGGRTLSASAACEPVTVPAGGGTFTPNCTVSGRSGFRLRDAWVELRARPESARTNFFLRAGQEKKPFSRYELTSSRNLPTIERGAGQGLPGRASNNLFESAGYLATDVGAHARLEHNLGGSRKAVLTVGVYNGQGESLSDVNDAKSFGARATIGVTRRLEIGGAWFRHDAIVAGDSSSNNTGFELDAQWGRVGDPGLFLLSEFFSGEDASAAKRSMRGFQVVAAWHARMGGDAPWLYAIEPAARFDVGDPDSDVDSDQVRTFTAVLGLYMSSRTQLRIAYEGQSFQNPGLDNVSGLRTGLAVNF